MVGDNIVIVSSNHYLLPQASEQMMKLYNVLLDSDATTVEINPMTEDKNGQGVLLSIFVMCYYMIITVYCMDAKINIDDNASYRQTELFNLRDYTQEDTNEVEASQYNLNYIKLDGTIGCVGKSTSYCYPLRSYYDPNSNILANVI